MYRLVDKNMTKGSQDRASLWRVFPLGTMAQDLLIGCLPEPNTVKIENQLP